MKWMFFCLIVFTIQFSFAQSVEIEKRYQDEQRKLLQFEQQLNELRQTLLAKGEVPKDNFDYVGLESQYKLQKKNFKIAEKAWKAQQKEVLKQQKLEEKQKAEQLRQEQINAARQSQTTQPSDLDTMTEKEKVKVLKKDIKRLQAYKKQLIQEAIEQGQDPTAHPKIKETNNYITKKQAEIISLGQNVEQVKERKLNITKKLKKPKQQKEPKREVNNAPVNISNTAKSDSESLELLSAGIKQKKKEIRDLKKKNKEIDLQLYNDPENKELTAERNQIQLQLSEKQKEINQLKAKLSSRNQSEKIAAKQIKKEQKQIKEIEQNLPENAQLFIDNEKIEELRNQLKQLKTQKKELTNSLKADPQNQKVNDDLSTTLRLIDAVKQQISVEKEGKIIEQVATTQPQQTVETIAPANKAPQAIDVQTKQKEVVEHTETEHAALKLPEIGLDTILFDKFSTEIKKDYHLYLNYIAKQLIENPHLVLQINAFTDNSEKERVSRELTANMAKEVAKAFLKRGISAERLQVKAKGSKNPVGDNKTYFGQIRNRRVELSFQTVN